MIPALYDIQGNLPALDAVLVEIPGDATTVVGGDICAMGDQPSEVLGLNVGTIVCGHTHMEFDRSVAGVWGANAGSVGMAYEEEPSVYWLLDVVHQRAPYYGAEPKAAGAEAEAVTEFTARGL